MSRSRIPTLGRWVLADAEGEVLLVGNDQFGGSATQRLDRVGRRALMPAMAEAIEDDTEVNERDVVAGEPTETHVEVIRAPHSGVPIATLGITTAPGGAKPAKPVVGAWEWLVAPPASFEDPYKISYWSDEMFDLYGLERARDNVAPPPSMWLGQIVVPEHQHRLKTYIDQGAEHVTPELRVLGYDVVAARGRTSMRLLGRAGVDPDGLRHLRGLTHEATGPVLERTPQLTDPSFEDFVATIFDLFDDSAIVMVELDYWSVYRQSPAQAWRALGLAESDRGSASTLVHPLDRSDFALFLTEVANGAKPRAARPVRLRGREGGWVNCVVHARPLSAPRVTLRQVLCRIVLA